MNSSICTVWRLRRSKSSWNSSRTSLEQSRQMLKKIRQQLLFLLGWSMMAKLSRTRVVMCPYQRKSMIWRKSSATLIASEDSLYSSKPQNSWEAYVTMQLSNVCFGFRLMSYSLSYLIKRFSYPWKLFLEQNEHGAHTFAPCWASMSNSIASTLH